MEYTSWQLSTVSTFLVVSHHRGVDNDESQLILNVVDVVETPTGQEAFVVYTRLIPNTGCSSIRAD
jgi:hypothetical protein